MANVMAVLSYSLLHPLEGDCKKRISKSLTLLKGVLKE